MRIDLQKGRTVEILPPGANPRYPIAENFTDALFVNDPGCLACEAQEGSWVDWVIEQVVRLGRHSSGAGIGLFSEDAQRNSFSFIG